MDTESRLSTEGKFYLGLNCRSEETCNLRSRPYKQNAATWKPLTGGDDKSERSTCGPRLGKPERKTLKGIQTQLIRTDRRYTALFPNNNALAVNLILILTTKYVAHTAEQCVCYV